MIQRPRILFFQRVVPPEHSAAGALALDMASGLATAGFDVGLLGTRTSDAVPEREICGGVEVVRVRVPSFQKSSLLSRAAALPGTWLALLRGVMRCRRPDVLVTLTDPPMAVCAGALLSHFFQCRHVHWCQDLYPGVAAAAGLMSPRSAAFQILEQLALSSMQSCTRVVAIGRCMQDLLRAAGVQNTALVSNWSRLAVPLTAPSTTGAPFIVLYSGNLGRAHDFEGINTAAEILARDGVEARIVVRGDGPRRKDVRLPVLPPVPWDDLPATLAATGAHLITMRREFCGLVVPSKLYDAAASGRPIIFAGPSECECARAIRENEMGLVVPDSDGPALASAVARLHGDPALCLSMGQAAGRFSAAHRQESAVRAFSAILEEALAPLQ